MEFERMKSGLKVTYKTPYKKEKGIIKHLTFDPNYVFVVYNCNGDWGDYKNYTAARTERSDLVEGWDDEI